MGEYVNVDGLSTYYQMHGAGAPLVLLHGGMATADSWDAQIPPLSQHYRVYVPERRAHGHTADVAGPISYALMAADTIAFLEALELPAAHLVGWSDGAVVAALVAIARPDLVGKLVLIGQYLQLDGERPEARAILDGENPMMEAMFRASYDPFSPDGPDHFPVVLAKMVDMWRKEPEIPLAEVATIQAPTLIMQGDDDLVRIEHSALLARTITGAQLAVVPGTSHALPLEKPDLINRLILEFLAGEQVTKILPLS